MRDWQAIRGLVTRRFKKFVRRSDTEYSMAVLEAYCSCLNQILGGEWALGSVVSIAQLEGRFGLSRSQARDCFSMLVHDGYIERTSSRQSSVFNWSQTDVEIKLDLWAETLSQCVLEIVSQGDVNAQTLLDLAGSGDDETEDGFVQYHSFLRALYQMVNEPKRTILLRHCKQLFSGCFYRVMWIGSGYSLQKSILLRDELVKNWSSFDNEGLAEQVRIVVLSRSEDILKYVTHLRHPEKGLLADIIVKAQTRDIMLDGKTPPLGIEGNVNAGMLKPTC